MIQKRVLIAAGGTGGHMFPARAAADALIARGWSVKLVTDARGAKHARDFPGDGVTEIEASSPFSKNPVKMAQSALKLTTGVFQARRILAEYQPHVVAGFGGYPAFPALTAAWMNSVPRVIHEQNAVLGRVNRLFAGSVVSVASGFTRLDKMPDSAVHAVTGNPVRAQVLQAREVEYQPPQPGGEIRLLVLGGSLGARILSETVPRAIAALPEDLRLRLKVVQQTREESLDSAREIYADAGVQAELSPFFRDMGRLYAETHLVISRSGASSVSEISAIGRPALFVPLAIAMDDHQTANAQGLVKVGAADMMTEAEFTVDHLRARLETLLSDGEALDARARLARTEGRPDAHERLADLIVQAAEPKT
ncbi:undecaprenyldiphospho-muramoylpentapeptide beta-N-acetylglucosaminyltransferase [Oceanicaulis sp.]|uniref:undecaprenyldiphospho-muramoylpentapeptide beta-N-acetylglucosaminyltransferase n=1 Tax=Oceanicaulis sp. TaxID=1924941 RepID=UPI003BAD6905